MNQLVIVLRLSNTPVVLVSIFHVDIHDPAVHARQGEYFRASTEKIRPVWVRHSFPVHDSATALGTSWRLADAWATLVPTATSNLRHRHVRCPAASQRAIVMVVIQVNLGSDGGPSRGRQVPPCVCACVCVCEPCSSWSPFRSTSAAAAECPPVCVCGCVGVCVCVCVCERAVAVTRVGWAQAAASGWPPVCPPVCPPVSTHPPTHPPPWT